MTSKSSSGDEIFFIAPAGVPDTPNAAAAEPYVTYPFTLGGRAGAADAEPFVFEIRRVQN
jgi:hypothetical protein